jgi:hypothetical protein
MFFRSCNGFTRCKEGTGGHASISDDGNGNVLIADQKQIFVSGLPAGSQGHIANVNNKAYGLRILDSGQVDILANASRHISVTNQVVRVEKAFRADGVVYFMPSADQSITAVSDSIVANAATVKITADAAYTLTSEPTIAAGTDGQIIILENVGANAITLQNTTALAGSLLRNSSAGAVVLGARDSVIYQYSSNDARWKQISDRMAL